MKLCEINIRDPFILPYNEKYYLYGTRVTIPMNEYPCGIQEGFDVYVSDDLEEWSGPKCVFEKNTNFWGEKDYWAPEVHIYQGKFYMFASFKAEGICRATHILISDQPDGIFVPLTDKPVTPSDWECLDGTFYVDKNGYPHIIFSHEWTQIGDGTVCEMKLSEDLTEAVSEPRTLWRASDYKEVVSIGQDEKAYVTDGPFIYRFSNEELYCIWSSFNENGYAELLSKSDNGDIDGNWTICEKPLFSNDGGHGMIFKDFYGNVCFIMHKPNVITLERPVIMEMPVLHK